MDRSVGEPRHTGPGAAAEPPRGGPDDVRTGQGLPPVAASEGTKASFLDFVGGPARDLPMPGRGATWQRFEALADIAAQDLSAGRLAEGHADALAILEEAGRSPVDGAAYGVWAARSPSGGPIARSAPGGWTVGGYQEFCSGSSIVNRALLAADGPRGRLLFDVDVDDLVVSRHPGSWPAVGMAGSDSGSLTVEGSVPDAALVGGTDYYTARCGFWWGAVGVAACWAGGARGLLDGLLGSVSGELEAHRMAALGRAVAAVDAIRAVLRQAAEHIDDEGSGSWTGAESRRRALSVRQTVHDRCREVLDHVVEAGGPRLVCHDPAESQRAADLVAYLSQHHGGADAADLGRLTLLGRPTLEGSS